PISNRRLSVARHSIKGAASLAGGVKEIDQFVEWEVPQRRKGLSRERRLSCGGTEDSNPCTLQSGYWLVGIVDWPNRAGLPEVAREAVLSPAARGEILRRTTAGGAVRRWLAVQKQFVADSLLESGGFEPT